MSSPVAAGRNPSAPPEAGHRVEEGAQSVLRLRRGEFHGGAVAGPVAQLTGVLPGEVEQVGIAEAVGVAARRPDQTGDGGTRGYRAAAHPYLDGGPAHHDENGRVAATPARRGRSARGRRGARRCGRGGPRRWRRRTREPSRGPTAAPRACRRGRRHGSSCARARRRLPWAAGDRLLDQIGLFTPGDAVREDVRGVLDDLPHRLRHGAPVPAARPVTGPAAVDEGRVTRGSGDVRVTTEQPGAARRRWTGRRTRGWSSRSRR